MIFFLFVASVCFAQLPPDDVLLCVNNAGKDFSWVDPLNKTTSWDDALPLGSLSQSANGIAFVGSPLGKVVVSMLDSNHASSVRSVASLCKGAAVIDAPALASSSDVWYRFLTSLATISTATGTSSLIVSTSTFDNVQQSLIELSPIAAGGVPSTRLWPATRRSEFPPLSAWLSIRRTVTYLD
jgi:hypothetical protein